MANLEEKQFTKAEMKMFSKKYEIFLEAQKAVDETVNFLKEQHEIPADDTDWQIGQNGFFKLQKVAAETPEDKKVAELQDKTKENGKPA